MRATNESHTVGEIDWLVVDGDLHQTWFREPDVGAIIVRTPYRENTLEGEASPEGPFPLELYWHAVVDSHFIPWCGVEADCDPLFTDEQNNGSNPGGLMHDQLRSLDGRIDNYEQIYGYGRIGIMEPDVAPLTFRAERRRREKDLLYLVTPADTSSGIALGSVALSLHVSGFDAAGTPLAPALDGELGTAYRLGPGVMVPFAVPEPSTATVSLLLGVSIGALMNHSRRRDVNDARRIGFFRNSMP